MAYLLIILLMQMQMIAAVMDHMELLRMLAQHQIDLERATALTLSMEQAAI
ncbi:hypothetical protein D3C72_2168560 [compost metagenome]